MHLKATKSKSNPIISEQKIPLPHLLKMSGYIHLKHVSNTSQGSIHNVTSTENKANYTIKVTDKALHEESMVYINGRAYLTLQSITKEASILRHLSSSNQASPSSLINYRDFFCDEYNYYLATEHIGHSMFNIVNQCHAFIKSKNMYIKEWHTFCRRSMKQMVNVLEWMHNTMQCCHLDVSLENFSIQNLDIIVTPSTKQMQICSDFQVKISNFGFAEEFESKNDDGEIDFSCNKYVGKTSYQAPKVYDQTSIFDARSADCWSLAVCFFMMLVGSAPFQRPSAADPLFNYIMNDQMIDVLQNWNVGHYVSTDICDLLRGLFVVEQDRLAMSDIKQHCWLNHDNI